MTTNLLPAKRDVCRALLLRDSVFIHLNPRTSGVIVPTRLRNQDQCVLQVGLHMPVPIPDLRVDEEGVYGTLSFKGVPYTVYVPWAAVFALVGEDAKGMVWPEDMPQSIKDEVARENAQRAHKERVRPTLQAVDGGQRIPLKMKQEIRRKPSGTRHLRSV